MNDFRRIELIFRPRVPCWIVVFAVAVVQQSPISIAKDPESVHELSGIVIHLDSDREIVVRTVLREEVTIDSGQRGLAIWPEGSRDRWQAFEGSWRRPSRGSDSAIEYLLQAQSRGNETARLDVVNDGTTTQLAQIRFPEITRASNGLTVPYDGALLLSGRVTFRRSPALAGQKLAAANAIVRKDGVDLFRFRFRADEVKVKWSELAEIPPTLRDGLPSGRYQVEISTATGPQLVSFRIADASVKIQEYAGSPALAKLLPADSALTTQIHVEQLLSHRPPFLADAMDQFDDVPNLKLTSRLQDLKRFVEGHLKASADSQPLQMLSDPTNDDMIDKIRELIHTNAWSEALEQLDSIIGNPSTQGKRRFALAQMYRGVVLGESGEQRQKDVTSAFLNAIEIFREIADSDEDLRRAHSNFANFLLGRAQDRLQNHAFQIATDTKLPLLTAMSEWIEARDQYELAGRSAESNAAKAAFDQARLYAFLGDILLTLRDPMDGAEAVPGAEQAALDKAKSFAERAIRNAEQNDRLTVAACRQLLAVCNFRQGKIADSIANLKTSLGIYDDLGSLTGLENVHRSLGLCYQKAGAANDNGLALNHFLVSEAITEILRDRFPVDKSGQSRAGFFARRAYVSEHVIELLINEGRVDAALQNAEKSKARALHDILAARDLSITDEHSYPVTLGNILTNWPNNTTAVEYFLGTERCYMFVVDRFGKVKVLLMKGNDGRELQSRHFVARVRQLLNGMDHYAERLRLRLSGGRGFDHEWQESLAQMREVLLPSEVLAELKKSEIVVIVPHHILHYFPFASLVTEKDHRELGKFDMPNPRFLIDEKVDLVCAPSLAVWRNMQSHAAPRIETAAAVGIVDLPGAPRLDGVTSDLADAKRHYGSKLTETLTESNATEGAVVKILERNGALLLALHGSNHPDRPLDSFLLMFPDEKNDGRLTADELYRHPVRRELIVLSACYSGLSDRSPAPGDDLFGIQRALVSSGAKTIVSGLWDVYDATAPELISGFHERITAGQPAAHSLAESQRAFLAKYRATGEVEPFLHPYFWGVYTLFGDHRTSCVTNSHDERTTPKVAE